MIYRMNKIILQDNNTFSYFDKHTSSACTDPKHNFSFKSLAYKVLQQFGFINETESSLHFR